MTNESATIVLRLWIYCNVLRVGGVSNGDYRTAYLPVPDILAQEIVENREPVLMQFQSILEASGKDGSE